jgi:hypothetical protein
VLRLAVLDLVTHMVVANGALVQSCLQTLVYSLLPPPGPPLPDPTPGEAWQPAAGQAQVQDEVVAAAEKVRALPYWQREKAGRHSTAAAARQQSSGVFGLQNGWRPLAAPARKTSLCVLCKPVGRPTTGVPMGS